MRKYDLTRMKRAKARQTKFREFLGCTLIALISVIGTVGVAYGRDMLTNKANETYPDCAIYDVYEYWTVDEDTYIMDIEVGNSLERYTFNIPDAPSDISEVVLSWNGNQEDVQGYTFITCR